MPIILIPSYTEGTLLAFYACMYNVSVARKKDNAFSSQYRHRQYYPVECLVCTRLLCVQFNLISPVWLFIKIFGV